MRRGAWCQSEREDGLTECGEMTLGVMGQRGFERDSDSSGLVLS